MSKVGCLPRDEGGAIIVLSLEGAFVTDDNISIKTASVLDKLEPIPLVV